MTHTDTERLDLLERQAYLCHKEERCVIAIHIECKQPTASLRDAIDRRLDEEAQDSWGEHG
jgi:hypothetical protein